MKRINLTAGAVVVLLTAGLAGCTSTPAPKAAASSTAAESAAIPTATAMGTALDRLRGEITVSPVNSGLVVTIGPELEEAGVWPELSDKDGVCIGAPVAPGQIFSRHDSRTKDGLGVYVWPDVGEAAAVVIVDINQDCSSQTPFATRPVNEFASFELDLPGAAVLGTPTQE